VITDAAGEPGKEQRRERLSIMRKHLNGLPWQELAIRKVVQSEGDLVEQKLLNR